MKNINQYLVLSLFCAFTIKSLVAGAGLADAAILLILAAAHFLHTSQIQNKEILELRSLIKALSDKQDSRDEMMADVKDNMSAVKLASGLRSSR